MKCHLPSIYCLTIIQPSPSPKKQTDRLQIDDLKFFAALRTEILTFSLLFSSLVSATTLRYITSEIRHELLCFTHLFPVFHLRMGRLTKDALNAAPFWDTPSSLTLARIPEDKRLDDTATGYLALCAKVGITTKRSLEKYRFNFERDGKLRATHLNMGRAFLGPDNFPLKVDRRSLYGSADNKPHESKYTLDSIHLHPQYQDWLEKTLSTEDLALLPSNSRTHPRKSYKNANSTSRITQTTTESLQKSCKDVHSTLGITKTVTGSLKEIIQLKAENAAIKAELKTVKEETALVYEAVNNADVKTN